MSRAQEKNEKEKGWILSPEKSILRKEMYQILRHGNTTTLKIRTNNVLLSTSLDAVQVSDFSLYHILQLILFYH